MDGASIGLEPEVRRAGASAALNYTWSLLERAGRTSEEDDLMVHAAHASRFLWEEVGGPTERARGEWQVSRVYAVLGRAEPALHHARRCLAICEANGIGGFDLGFAKRGACARVRLAGDEAEAGRHAALGREQAAGVEDEDDRQVLLDDLATLAVSDRPPVRQRET